MTNELKLKTPHCVWEMFDKAGLKYDRDYYTSERGEGIYGVTFIISDKPEDYKERRRKERL